jgi:ribonuclease P protein component
VPRLAWAIGRRVGPAVTRNRLRRRLRSAAALLDQPEPLAPGSYLVALQPGAADLSYGELRDAFEAALRRAVTRAGRGAP